MIGDYHNVKADRLVNAEIQRQNRMWGERGKRDDVHEGQLMHASMAQLDALSERSGGDSTAFDSVPGVYPAGWSGFRDYGSDIANLVVAAAFIHQEIARKLSLGEEETRTSRDAATQPYTKDQPKEILP